MALRRSGYGVAVLAGALALAVLVAGVTFARAQTANSTSITACVNRYTGFVRIVNSGSCWAPLENTLTWDRQGPSGPTGPTGVVGPSGLQGPPGTPLPGSLSGFEVVRAIKTYEDATYATVPQVDASATCPEGKMAIGGGVSIDVSNGPSLDDFKRVHVRYAFAVPAVPPDPPMSGIPSSFQVGGALDETFVGPATITVSAWAHCAIVAP
ncbi:MAG: hypothetical protein AB7I38_07175 [Dehalococcoidia bacterium]